MSTNNNKETFVKDMIERTLENVPIATVVRDVGVQLTGSEPTLKGCSPFGVDRSPTSFTLCTQRNIFTDWVKKSSGYTGSVIKFYFLYHDYPKDKFIQAAFDLALKYGIINEDEYKEYYKGRRYSKKYVNGLIKKHSDSLPRVQSNKAEPEVLDKVFRMFMQFQKLKEEHKNHLLKERLFTEEEIVESLIFSYPTRAVMRKFIKAITEEYGSQDILKSIPGFYRRKNDKNFTFGSNKGFVIPIKDEFGRIVGFQIRQDITEAQKKKMAETGHKKSKYVWFSSSKAVNDPNEELFDGTSSGSPVYVYYPKELKWGTVFITEGYFKAKAIAEEFGCIALSVQGVGTWRGIDTIIDNLETLGLMIGDRPYKVTNIFAAFDADLCYNYNVFKQLKKMTDVLKRKLDKIVKYIFWDVDLGKGIDDVINYGEAKSLQKYYKEIYDKEYQRVMNLAEKGEGKKLDEITKDIFRGYFDQYMRLDEALEVRKNR